MRGALRIGKVFGIDVGVDWSWGLIVLLLSWNLASLFQRWHPAWPLGLTLLLALAGSLLFFASVLAHELAHSVVAKAYGMTVREIRLFLFGGVSDIERDPPSPSAELLIAIAGPVTSLAIGAALVVGAGLTLPTVEPTRPWEGLAEMGPVGTLLFWLGPSNVAVGLFNLVPGFPLDGGRVLRATVWKMTGNLHEATVAASLVGRGIGWLLVALGVSMVLGAEVPFFGQGAAGGLWLAFIGWFLSAAAERSVDAMRIRAVLDGVRVEHLMRRSGGLVPADANVLTVAYDGFMHSDDHAFPVIDAGRFVGLVCVGDVRKVPHDEWDRTPVEAVMTPREKLVVVAPRDDIQDALRKLDDRDVDQLPVLDGESLVGIVTRSEIGRWVELHVGGQRRRVASLGRSSG